MIRIKYLIVGFVIGITISNFNVIAEMGKVISVNVQFYFNNQIKEMHEDMTTLKYKDRIYVPIRFVSETLQKDVYWDDGQIYISDKKPYGGDRTVWYDDEWDYYKKYNNITQKHSIIKCNGKEKNEIYSGKLYNCIASNDNYVYFIDYSNQQDIFYQINKDGTNKVEIASDVYDFMIINDYIYYAKACGTLALDKKLEDNSYYELYRISKKDNEHKLIIKGKRLFLRYYADGYIYLTIDNENILSRLNIDGRDLSHVIDLKDINEWIYQYKFLYIKGNNLYFNSCHTNYYTSLYMIDLNTKMNKLIIEKNSGVAMDDEYIYYVETINNESLGNKLYKMKYDGSDKKLLYEGEIGNSISLISSTKDWLYFNLFYDYGIESYKARIRKNGSNFEILE